MKISTVACDHPVLDFLFASRWFLFISLTSQQNKLAIISFVDRPNTIYLFNLLFHQHVFPRFTDVVASHFLQSFSSSYEDAHRRSRPPLKVLMENWTTEQWKEVVCPEESRFPFRPLECEVTRGSGRVLGQRCAWVSHRHGWRAAVQEA